MSNKFISQKEIEELAKQMVGDGQSPNKWFVSVSPYTVYYRPDDTEAYTRLLEGYTSADKSIYGPFDTYEEALECYNNTLLDELDGIGQVLIEDRLVGCVKEKWLEERTIVKYIENSYTDYATK